MITPNRRLLKYKTWDLWSSHTNSKRTADETDGGTTVADGELKVMGLESEPNPRSSSRSEK